MEMSKIYNEDDDYVLCKHGIIIKGYYRCPRCLSLKLDKESKFGEFEKQDV